MNTVLLPELSRLDEHSVDFETLLSFVDAGGQTVVASHLLVAPGMPPEPSSVTLDALDLTRAEDRRHCLLHAAAAASGDAHSRR